MELKASRIQRHSEEILTGVGGRSHVGSKGMKSIISEPRFPAQELGVWQDPYQGSGGAVMSPALGIPNLGVQDISSGQLVLHGEVVLAEWASQASSLD